MKHTSKLRIGLGALAATAALGAVPAMASAQATCSFDPSTARVNVQMQAKQPVTIARAVEATGQLQDARILVDGQFCSTANGKLDAGLSFTQKIVVRSASGPLTDTVIVDERNGPLQNPVTAHRPTVVALTGTGGDTMQVIGTEGADHYTATSGLGAVIDLGGSNGIAPDFTSSAVGRIVLIGQGGPDNLSAGGALNGIGVRAEISGGAGRDIMTGGRSGIDLLDGNSGDDLAFVANSKPGDRAIGGDGVDTVFRDAGDTASGFENGQ